ncbi:hypothetical protein D9758_000714 [Tetrapyrgos nigripes]|uniref:Macro domain-containing protein n=1 Tax=Tetrapyrgos nigripes TaxID=182062 RepID=A0A8H5LYE8_9AGAR|nr:hypothetical protein D9758_000714 [Tetrapyrgos nigripes]
MRSMANVQTLRQLFKHPSPKYTLASIPKEKQKYPVNGSLLDRVSLWQGDITKLQVDAIVNAANKRLLGGGGVDGAIHAAAGRGLLEECRTLNGAEIGESKITKGYNLPAKHVIHTVGPIYSYSSPEDVELKAKQLTSCYRTSLELAVKRNLKQIAFCSISTGIYGYPIEDATDIALDTVRNFCESDTSLEQVIFVVWSDKDKHVYEALIPEYFPPDTEYPSESDSKVEASDSKVKDG